MAKTTRIVRDTTFVAEVLEELADSLPPGEEAKARILREAAAIYGQLPMRRLVHVQEEKEDVNQAAARVVREATEK
ncbi:MAG: hypothetical protein WCA10_17915 [Terracidiphilus sp.]